MTTQTKKKVERAYLEIARTSYAQFPEGDIIDFEAPDFIVSGQDGTTGFEITKLYQPSANSPFSPRQIESFHTDVIRLAEQYYIESDLPWVEVRAYLTHTSGIKQDKKQLARSIAAFIIAHRPTDRQILNFSQNRSSDQLPEIIGAISIAPPLTGHKLHWFAGAFGETQQVTRDLIADIIATKNPLVRNYRTRVNKVWLLIVADMFPFSASFSVPQEVEQWRFDYAFDKALLLSREELKVWPLFRT